jgi:hypothetical protein
VKTQILRKKRRLRFGGRREDKAKRKRMRPENRKENEKILK